MKKALMLLTACLLLYACGSYEGTIQKADKSYLKFTGNWQNTVVQIDGTQSFELRAPSSTDDPRTSPSNTLYQLSPGKHRVTVTRGGIVVVDKLIFLKNDGTTEVLVP
ncbi:MAG: hypothetical protein ACLPX5_08550 [Dissulfurispiraceae bacterium]